MSSLIATAGAVAFSFVLNRTFVFHDRSRPGSKLAMFLIVSVAGVLLVQNTVFALMTELIHGREGMLITPVYAITHIRLASDFYDVNFSDVIASLCVMVWNYNGYRLFVFRNNRKVYETAETITTATN